MKNVRLFAFIMVWVVLFSLWYWAYDYNKPRTLDPPIQGGGAGGTLDVSLVFNFQ